MESFMKQPCKHCPFRNDVTPFLHPDRAVEIAYASQNEYADFWCHKTTESDDESGECYATEESKLCAGFLTLRAQGGNETPKGFEPSWEVVYIDEYDMIQAYEEEWEKQHKKYKTTQP